MPTPLNILLCNLPSFHKQYSNEKPFRASLILAFTIPSPDKSSSLCQGGSRTWFIKCNHHPSLAGCKETFCTKADTQLCFNLAGTKHMVYTKYMSILCSINSRNKRLFLLLYVCRPFCTHTDIAEVDESPKAGNCPLFFQPVGQILGYAWGGGR